MWRAVQDYTAPCAVSSAVMAPPEIHLHQGAASMYQHPESNPTPFSSFPSAWVVGASCLPSPLDLHSRFSGNTPSSITQPPSDLIPRGLLATPQPSTPGNQLLKVLVSNRLTIPVHDAGFSSANGALGDSPGNSTGPTICPMDSLVLPSPSLLPGGVHSLPTPTSSSSQPVKPSDAYGMRGSPIEIASMEDSILSGDTSGSAKAPMQVTRAVEGATSRHSDTTLQQQFSGIGNAVSTSDNELATAGRRRDVSSYSAGANAGQLASSRNPQQQAPANHHVEYSTSPLQFAHGMQHPPKGPYQLSQQAPLGAATAAVGGMVQPPGSPFYVSQMPPGPLVIGMHHSGSGSGSANSGGAGPALANGRTYTSGQGVHSTARDGSGWRGASRNASGSGTLAVSGVAGGGNCLQAYGPTQQMMQGGIVHDGTVASYGVPHMPYTVFGMMAPSIVMPQVISPVVGSPRNIDAHGQLAHQQVHLGPMVMQHGPSMTLGMGVGHHMHPFATQGHMVGPHMGVHHHPHIAAHSHGTFPMAHGQPHYHSGGYTMGQHHYGQLPMSEMHTQGTAYSSARVASVKASGPQPSARASRSGACAGTASAGSAEVGNITASGSARETPVTGRGRREKVEGKSRTEQRERKPGNSRAPAAIAQCALDMPSLEAQLQDLVGQLTPHQDELIAHQVAWKAVKELVNGHWPDVKVHLFGSAANGLSLARANKIDITIEVPNMAWDDHAAKSAMVAELGELASGISAAVTGSVRLDGNNGKGATEAETLSDVERLDKRVLDADGEGSVAAMMGKAAPNEGKADPASPVDSVVGSIADDVDAVATLQTRPSSILSAVTALPKARTPVVKVTVTSTQTRVDVTINNLLAISNTRMVGHYFEIDPRLRQLALLVKHWARTRGVNDAYRGSLSSYAYVLLCIWLLQKRQPAILPVLQQREPHTYETTVGPWRCAYNDQIEEVKNCGVGNKETLAELLVAFFDHWAWRHDYNGSVVCVRTGGTVPKSAKEWTKRQGNERHLMCIEDPFELSHDLGRTIDKAAVQVLRREFERAARIFASHPDPLPELLAPLTPEEEAAVAAALQSRRKASKDKERSKEKHAAAVAAVAAAASGDVSPTSADVGVMDMLSYEQRLGSERDENGSGMISEELESEAEGSVRELQIHGLGPVLPGVTPVTVVGASV